MIDFVRNNKAVYKLLVNVNYMFI